MSDLHKIRVTIPDGRAILSKIEVDGQELRGVTLVKIEVGIPEKHVAQITLRLYADIEVDGEADIVKEWRNARDLRPLAPKWYSTGDVSGL